MGWDGVMGWRGLVTVFGDLPWRGWGGRIGGGGRERAANDLNRSGSLNPGAWVERKMCFRGKKGG